MPLLTMRTTLIFTAAVLLGVGAGVLTFLDGRSLAAAILAGGAAMAAAVVFLDRVIAQA